MRDLGPILNQEDVVAEVGGDDAASEFDAVVQNLRIHACVER